MDVGIGRTLFVRRRHVRVRSIEMVLFRCLGSGEGRLGEGALRSGGIAGGEG